MPALFQETSGQVIRIIIPITTICLATILSIEISGISRLQNTLITGTIIHQGINQKSKSGQNDYTTLKRPRSGGIVGIAQCGDCGASVLEGSKFCPNCGTEFASPIAVEIPPGYKLVKDDSGNVSIARPKRRRVGVVLTLIVVAVLISAALLIVLTPTNQEGAGSLGTVKEGDYVLYTMTGTQGGKSISGTMKIEYTHVTSSTITIDYTIKRDSDGSSQTISQSYAYDGKNVTSTSSGFSDQTSVTNMTAQGREIITTSFGAMNVDKIQFNYSDGSMETDYLTIDSRIAVRMVYSSSTTILQCEIKETNIAWAGNGIPGPSFQIGQETMMIIGVVLISSVVVIIAILVFRRSKDVSAPELKTQTKFIEKTGAIAPICPSCGTLNDGSMYCRHCGKRLG